MTSVLPLSSPQRVPAVGESRTSAPVIGLGIAAFLFLTLPLAQRVPAPPRPVPVEEMAVALPQPPRPLEIPRPTETVGEATSLPIADPTPERTLPTIDPIDVAFDLTPPTGNFVPGRAITQEIAAGELVPLVDWRSIDVAPEALTKVAPVYPDTLRREGIPGRAVVEFTVLQDGTVTDPVIRESSHRELDRPVLDAIRKWRFAPPTYQGRPARYRLRLPFEFGPTR